MHACMYMLIFVVNIGLYVLELLDLNEIRCCMESMTRRSSLPQSTTPASATRRPRPRPRPPPRQPPFGSAIAPPVFDRISSVMVDRSQHRRQRRRCGRAPRGARSRGVGGRSRPCNGQARFHCPAQRGRHLAQANPSQVPTGNDTCALPPLSACGCALHCWAS